MKARVNIPNQRATQKRRHSLTAGEEDAARTAFYKFFNRPGGAVDLLFLAVGIIGGLVEAANWGSKNAAHFLRGLANISRDLDVKRRRKDDGVAEEIFHNDESREAFAMTAVAIFGRLIQEADQGSNDAEKALRALCSVCRAVGHAFPVHVKKKL